MTHRKLYDPGKYLLGYDDPVQRVFIIGMLSTLHLDGVQKGCTNPLYAIEEIYDTVCPALGLDKTDAENIIGQMRHDGLISLDAINGTSILRTTEKGFLYGLTYTIMIQIGIEPMEVQGSTIVQCDSVEDLLSHVADVDPDIASVLLGQSNCTIQ